MNQPRPFNHARSNPDNTATGNHPKNLWQSVIVKNSGDRAAISGDSVDKDKFTIVLHADHHFRNRTGGIWRGAQLWTHGINFLSFRISYFYDTEQFQQA